MPTRMLAEQDDFNSYKAWLDQNLVDENSIVPHIDNIPDTLTDKGIYFWFLDCQAYDKLSKYVQIDPLQLQYKRSINRKEYDLVYVGTAGTSNNKRSNMHDRLDWHINNSHSTSAICSGTLSTFRTGLSSLIAEDLILDDTEGTLNRLLSDCFRVYFLSYPKDEESNISTDEKLLINGLKPLLNIKNNPNARAASDDNPTKYYRVRRNEIISVTRERLGCNNHDNETIKTPKYTHQVIQEKGDCIEFTVSTNQSIHDVIRGITGLPKGKCTFCLYNSNDSGEYLFKCKSGNPYHSTGKSKQNIYSYFNNVASGNTPRWKIIQNEMAELLINEIVVHVYFNPVNKISIQESEMSINVDSQTKIETESKFVDLSKIEWKSKKDENKLLIIGCSDTKYLGGDFKEKPRDEFGNNLKLEALVQYRRQRLDYYKNEVLTKQNEQNLKTRNGYWKVRQSIDGILEEEATLEYLQQQLRDQKLLSALSRYGGGVIKNGNRKLIEQAITDKKLKVLIISGLYGILQYDDEIIDYHLNIKDGDQPPIGLFEDCINKYCIKFEIKGSNVFLLLSENYLKSIGNYAIRGWLNLWIKGDSSKCPKNTPRLTDFLNLLE